MFDVFQLQSGIWLVLTLVVVVGTGWALVDAMTRRPDLFVAGDKQTKNTWLLILGIAFAAAIFLQGLGMFIGAIAMLVYHLDVRPALARLTGR